MMVSASGVGQVMKLNESLMAMSSMICCGTLVSFSSRSTSSLGHFIPSILPRATKSLVYPSFTAS